MPAKKPAAKKPAPKKPSAPRAPAVDGAAAVEVVLASWAPWQRDIGARLHAAIVAAAPDLELAVRWGMPTYSRGGLVCYLGAFTKHVSLGFYDRAGLVGLEPGEGKGGVLRHAQGAPVDAPLVRALVQAAVARAA